MLKKHELSEEFRRKQYLMEVEDARLRMEEQVKTELETQKLNKVKNETDLAKEEFRLMLQRKQ
jgi:hypothetical protein